MIEAIIDIFLLPWTLLGWLLKWFFSAAIWVTVIGGLWYFISSSKWSITSVPILSLSDSSNVKFGDPSQDHLKAFDSPIADLVNMSTLSATMKLE